MMNAIRKPEWTALFTALALFAASCVSPEKLLETGDFDRAIDVSVDKLVGRAKKNPRYVEALAQAFDRANERDLAAAEALRRENRPENWDRILSLYQRVAQRQNKVAPLLPLADKHGIRAEVRLVQVEELIREARQNSAAYHYNRALDLMAQARRGDRLAARQAHEALTYIDRYFRDYRDKENLKREALKLGTSHILVNVRNDAQVILPAFLEADLRRLPVRDLDSRWRQYHTNASSGLQYDYEVVVSMMHIEVSPAVVREREYEDLREVEDGFEYILDSRGNVMKDSAGNDITVPRKVLVRARVFETWQHKTATLQCRVDFFDKYSGALIDTWPIAADAVFENYASTFTGDRRALSDQSRKRLGNRPLPFPPDEALLLQASESLKPIIKNRIARARVTV